MADTMNIIAAHRLTGGTQWSLDWFPIASLIDQDKAVVTDGTNIYFFEFDATSVAAEDVVTHPYKVRPDDYSTAGVWIEQQTVGGGGGSGTVTSVSVTTANGVSGTVATATTTPAITLTLGAITPSTVNGLTLTAQATGFTISGGTTSKTLTLSGDATIDGTEIKTTSQVTALSATASGDKDKYLHSNSSTGVLEWSTLSITEKWQENATVLSPTTAGNTVSIPLLDIYNVSTTGLLLANTTPSVIGRLIQYSPAIQFTGTAHDTNDNVSREHHWRIENRPVNGNVPTSTLNFLYALEAGSYASKMSLTSGGSLTIDYHLYCRNAYLTGSLQQSSTNTTTTPTIGGWHYAVTDASVTTKVRISPWVSVQGNVWDESGAGVTKKVQFITQCLPVNHPGAIGTGIYQIGYDYGGAATYYYPFQLYSEGRLVLNSSSALGSGNLFTVQNNSIDKFIVDNAGICQAVGGYKSADGTAGESATITIGANTITVKNGLVVAHS